MSEEQNKRRERRRGFLGYIALLPVLLLFICCGAQIGVLTAGYSTFGGGIYPLETADYSAWARFRFGQVKPEAITQAFEERGLQPDNYASTGVAFLSSTPLPSVTPTATATPTHTPVGSGIDDNPNNAIATNTPNDANDGNDDDVVILLTENTESESTLTAIAESTNTPTSVPVTATPVPTNTPTLDFVPTVAPPIADFDATENAGTVNFINRSNGVIDTYQWDFGDGGSSQVTSPTHTYTSPGNFWAALTVIGPGGTDTARVLITVLPPNNPTNTPRPPATNTPVPSPTAQPVVLALSFFPSKASPAEGEDFVYTLRVTNNGSQVATNVDFSVSLSSGLIAGAANAQSGSYANGIWSIPSIGAAGSSTQLEIPVEPAAGTNGLTLISTATVTSVTPTNSGQSSVSSQLNVVGVIEADLAITKTVSDPTPDETDAIVYEITVQNASSYPASNTQVIDNIPAGVTVTANSASQGSYGGGIWNVGTISGGRSATLYLFATVDVGTIGQTLTNTASITADEPDPNSANNSDSATIIVQNPAGTDLELTLMASSTTLDEGDPVTLTLTLTNNGPIAASSILIDATLIPELSLVSSSGEGAYSGITWSLPSLDSGGSATLVVNAVVNTGAGGTSPTQTVTITGGNEPDPDAGNNSASVLFNIAQLPGADLEFTVFTFNDLNPAVGDTIDATVSITNQGPDTATNIILGDSFGSGALGAVQNVTLTHGTSSGGQWTIPTLNSGETATMTITLTVEASAAGTTVTRWREIVASDQPDPDSTPNNGVTTEDDYNTYTVVVQPIQNDLAIAINSLTDPINSLEFFDMSYEITNFGSTTTTNVQVTSTLPPDFDFVSSSDCSAVGADITCNLGDMAGGEVRTLTLTVKASSGPRQENHTATVTGTEPDLISSNNTDTILLDIGQLVCPSAGEPNIGPANGKYCSMASGTVIDLGSSPIVTQAGAYDFVYYEIQVEPGMVHLDHMIIEVGTSSSGPWHEVFNWSDGAIDLNSSVGQAGYGAGSEPDNFSLPAATPQFYGTSPYITGIAIDVGARAPAGTYQFVRFSMPGGGNVTLDALQAINEPYTPVTGDLSISVEIPPTDVRVGEPFDIIYHVTNSSSAALHNINVTSTVSPGQLGFNSSTDCILNGNKNVSCELVELAAGASHSFTISARPERRGTWSHTANVSASEPDPDLTNNTDTVNIVAFLPDCPTADEPNIGPANGKLCLLKGSLVLDLGSSPVNTQTSAYDLVYYEKLTGDGSEIFMDQVRIEVSDNAAGPWAVVFDWGDNSVDLNTNIGLNGYGSTGEANNTRIPTTNPPLYGAVPYVTGIAIDVDAVTNPGTYRYVRLTTAGGVEIDAVEPVNIPYTSVLADLQLSKSASETTVTVGQTFEYTVTVTNVGPDAASNITIVDTLPAEVSYVSGPGACSEDTGTVTCVIPMLGGASGQASVTYTVEAVSVGTAVNNAVVSADEPDPDLNNNQDSIDVIVQSNADLVITSTDPVDPKDISIEDTVVTFTIENQGLGDAADVVFNGTFAEGFRNDFYQATTPSQGTCTWADGVKRSVTCTLGTITAGGTATVRMEYIYDKPDSIATTTGSVITTTAEVSTANNTVTEQTTVVNGTLNIGNPDGSFFVMDCVPSATEKIVDLGSPVVPGIGYDIAVYDSNTFDLSSTSFERVIIEVGQSNSGPWDEVLNWGDGILDTNTTLGAAGWGGSSDPGANETADPIPTGGPQFLGTSPYDTGVGIDIDTRSTLPYFQYVRFSTGRCINGDRPEFDAIEILSTSAPTADLTISSVDTADPVEISSATNTINITVENIGSADASDVVLSSPLPANTFYDSGYHALTTTQGTCNFTGSSFDCALGSVAAGATVSIVVEYGPYLLGTYTLTSTVTTTSPEVTTANNNTSEETVVVDGTINIGLPDGSWSVLDCSGGAVQREIDLGSPVVPGSGYDIVVYEANPLDPSNIRIEHLIVEIAETSSGPWDVVYNWGDGALDGNTSLGAAGWGGSTDPGAGEPQNTSVPSGSPAFLGTAPYDSGIGIDVNGPSTLPSFQYVRFRAGACATNEASEIDAIELLY